MVVNFLPPSWLLTAEERERVLVCRWGGWHRELASVLHATANGQEECLPSLHSALSFLPFSLSLSLLSFVLALTDIQIVFPTPSFLNYLFICLCTLLFSYLPLCKQNITKTQLAKFSIFQKHSRCTAVFTTTTKKNPVQLIIIKLNNVSLSLIMSHFKLFLTVTHSLLLSLSHFLMTLQWCEDFQHVLLPAWYFAL